MKRKWARLFQKMHPAWIIILSYLLMTLLGTFFLALPVATVGEAIAPLDAFFTATSALCVTGLAVVDVGSTFTVFGRR